MMGCVCSMQHVEAVQQEVGAFSAQDLPGHGKKNHGFRRTIARGEYLCFCRSRPFGFSKMAILYQVDALAEFCFKNLSKIFESNAVFIKKMLQSSIIVHRALYLIFLLCMPMWSLTRAIEKADPVSLGILNMPIIVLIHICLSPGSS